MLNAVHSCAASLAYRLPPDIEAHGQADGQRRTTLYLSADLRSILER